MQERRHLATVVIVNCNYEQFIADAIDSALAQSYEPLEVVVVDDGSTDRSREIVLSYGNRVRAVFKNNGGQGSAYNAGWRAARGDFVLFLDSDDLLSPDAPREQIRNYGYYVSPPASGNVFRKSFLDEIMPVDEEPNRRAADGYTTGLAGLDGRVHSISETLGYYRIHGGNGGGEGGVHSIKQLHHMFMRDISRENCEHLFGPQFNFHFPPDRSRYCPGHTKLRLLSRRMAPDAHPIKTDRVFDLVVSGLVSAVKFPHLKLSKRFGVAVGFIGLGIMPRPMLRKYFDTIVSPQKRNRTADRIAV
jgi:glycosyltransferase involved in cell wall biosynthesis